MVIRRLLIAMFAFLGVIGAPFAARAADPAPYDALLARYVTKSPDGINRVRYAAWASNAADVQSLKAYVNALEKERPSVMTRNEQLAFWINLYNSVTLQVVLEKYPVRSIRDIRSKTLNPRGLIGPWLTPRVTVEGKRLTLDDIENAILRPAFKDPRIHYAINCASIGCPNLAARAWRAETIDSDLTEAARVYINHPRGVTLDGKGKVRASSIYQWFASDFGGNTSSVLDHLRRYALPELQAQLAKHTTIASYGYDWSLNSAK
jgi:hypothetical protein